MGFKPRDKVVSKDRAAPKSVETLVAAFKRIVPRLYAAEQEWARQNGWDDGETFEEYVDPAATQDQISRLEADLGCTLPPSYRGFLSLYNGGYFGFGGGAKLLGTEDHQDPHIVKTLEWKRTMFDEFEPVNPMNAKVIPLVVGTSRNMVLLEPPVDGDGEMSVVEYYLTKDERRHRDLVQFLQHKLDAMEKHIRPRSAKKTSKLAT